MKAGSSSARCGAPRRFPDCSLPVNANDLPPALDGRLREVYAQELRDFAPGARIVTDTYPAIISYVGRIAAAIPQARFVFMRREHDDLALRIFHEALSVRQSLCLRYQDHLRASVVVLPDGRCVA